MKFRLINYKFLAHIEQFINIPYCGSIFQFARETLASFWLKLGEKTLPEELLKYQFYRLRLIAKKAYRLPFYGAIFEKNNVVPNELKSPHNLAKLPVLYKKDFRTCPEKDYIDFDLGKKRGYWARTSGSSGEPFRILRDKKYQAQVKAFNLNCYRWFNIDINSKKVNFISVGRSSPSAWGNPNNDKYISVEGFQNKIGEYIDFLEQYKPTVLEANPSYLMFFAHAVAEKNKKITIPYIVSYGEQLYDEERNFLKKTFSAEVINRYGLTEITNVGMECPAHECFHANALACLVEMVDENGAPINDEKEGEIVLTSFINEITPLIRYGTGDRGRWILEPCPCGRNLPRFQLTGRRDDFVLLRNGKIIYIAFFRSIFYKYLEKIRQFRIVQETVNKISIYIVPKKDWNDSDEKKLFLDLKELGGNNVEIIINKTENLPWLAGGKFKTLIRL